MAIDYNSLRDQLGSLDMSAGLTRDQLREQLPSFPTDVYIYLPSMKKFYSPEDVMEQTGEHALARAEGEMAGPDLDLPTDGALEIDGPPAFGGSLSPGDGTQVGQGDYPGVADDLGGNSLETSAGRGIPDDVR